MNVRDFLNSIYLGDRGCKKIIINPWESELEIVIDLISRVRSEDGEWNFYTDEDIEDGSIVFGDVNLIKYNSKFGGLPNSYINKINLESENDGVFEFVISIDSINEELTSSEVLIVVYAKRIFLRNPIYPGVEIHE